MHTTAFYDFMQKREAIRLARLEGRPRSEWTDDEILKTYKFTNVKREHDRTSIGLFKLYDQYEKETSWTYQDCLLTCAAYRYFGTVEMAEMLGVLTEFQFKSAGYLGDYIRKCAVMQAVEKRPVFTGAYIVPNCGDPRAKYLVVADILCDIWEASAKIVDCGGSWNRLCTMMQKVSGVGAFMSKEVTLDYVYATKWTPDDWNTWTPVGPGARRGASRMLSPDYKVSTLSETKALEVIKELFSVRYAYWPKDGVNLCLTDIQFQLCEFDKYMRTKLGEGTPKTKFKPRS